MLWCRGITFVVNYLKIIPISRSTDPGDARQHIAIKLEDLVASFGIHVQGSHANPSLDIGHLRCASASSTVVLSVKNDSDGFFISGDENYQLPSIQRQITQRADDFMGFRYLKVLGS
jgi:hypothetical protein